jgi:hypothetical protein
LLRETAERKAGERERAATLLHRTHVSTGIVVAV